MTDSTSSFAFSIFFSDLKPFIQMATTILKDLPRLIPASYEYTEEAMQIEPTICQKLKELPPLDFEGVLHPVFEEDEVKLIIVGGVLGFAAGMLQVLTVV